MALTPGTLSIEIERDWIWVPRIDCPGVSDLTTENREISVPLERQIRGLLR
jgi:multisubunit Na+/H+ antiporter MnhE subunit